jgi:hypothetical protein
LVRNAQQNATPPDKKASPFDPSERLHGCDNDFLFLMAIPYKWHLFSQSFMSFFGMAPFLPSLML